MEPKGRWRSWTAISMATCQDSPTQAPSHGGGNQAITEDRSQGREGLSPKFNVGAHAQIPRRGAWSWL